jgi:hypothetical protein
MFRCYTDLVERATSVVEDVRKVIQDVVTPELKSLSVKLDGFEREAKLRDENLANDAKIRGELTQVKLGALGARLDGMNSKMDGMSAKMDAQYSSIMNALDLSRRVETLERDKQSASVVPA